MYVVVYSWWQEMRELFLVVYHFTHVINTFVIGLQMIKQIALIAVTM